MIVKRKSIRGGYCFKNFQGQPEDILNSHRVPDQVMLPLKHGFGKILIPTVEAGDKVYAGQIIARDDASVSSPLLASISGTVKDVIEVDLHGSQSKAIRIESDGSVDWTGVEGAVSKWENTTREQIENVLYLSGTSSLGSAGIPTRFGSSIILPDEVEHVIIQAFEDGAFSASSTYLLRRRVDSVSSGISILKKILPNAEFHIAFNSRRSDQLNEVMTGFKGQDGIRLYRVLPKYPTATDEVLVSLLLNREFPYGFSVANLGVIVLDVPAVLQVFDAVADGKPLIERTIALAGPGFKQNLHLNVRIGTPISDVVRKKTVREKGIRIVYNNSLTGPTISDLSLPVGQDCAALVSLFEEEEGGFLSFAQPGLKKDSYTRSFLSLFLPVQKESGTNLHGEQRACLSCGFCEEVCPVGIMPNLIHRYIQRDMIDEAVMNFKIFHCIDCNLCSYVCPSKIPVAALMEKGKKRLLAEGLDPSDGIRSRFQLRGQELWEGMGER